MNDRRKKDSEPLLDEPTATFSSEFESESQSESESDGQSDSFHALADRIATCQQNILRNPYDYEARMELVKSLRMTGDLDQLRAERKAMHELFPLTEDTWLAWIEDEMKLARSSEEKGALFELFQHSVSDYIAPRCWIKFGEFLCEWSANNPSNSSWTRSKEDMVALFENGLASLGLLMSNAEPFWELYRRFEAANNLPAEADKKVRSLFHRQLKIPHHKIRETFQAYEQWETSRVPSVLQSLKPTIEATLLETEKRFVFESKLNENDLASFMQYIQFEMSVTDRPNSAKVKLLYELAIKAQPLSEPLWQLYIVFLRENLNVKSVMLNVCERSVKNMPWSWSLWITYLEMLELHDRQLCGLEDIFSKATSYLTSSVDELVEFLVAFVDLKRRKYCEADVAMTGKEGGGILSELNHVLEHCIQIRSQHFDQPDALFKLERYSGWMHAKYASLEKFRSVWEIVIKSHSNEAAFWIEFISLEKFYGSVSKCQTLFKRAAAAVTDYPESIFSAWIEFEKYYGQSIEELHFARKRIEAQRLLLAERHDHKEKKELDLQAKRMEGKKDARLDTEDKSTVKIERKRPIELIENDYAKRIKSNEEHVVFISNIPYRASKDEIEQFLISQFGSVLDVRLIADAKGQYKGYGYVAFENEDSVQRSLSADRILFQGRPLFISPNVREGEERPRPAHITSDKDPKTLFVSNLVPTFNQNDLFSLFSPMGDIEQIRLVTRKDGTSKGRAYVEFKSEESASKALALHDTEHGGRRICVFISDPSQAKLKIQEKSTKFDSGLASSTFRTTTGLVPRTMTAHVRNRPRQKLGLLSSATASKPDSGATTLASEKMVEKPKSNSDFRAMFLKRSS